MRARFARNFLLMGLAISIVYFAPRGLTQFQAPSPDELKMVADPRYPNAAAVYLNYEAKTDAVYKDGVLMHLPPGLTIESAPPTTAVPWSGYAMYQIKLTPNGNDLSVTRTLARAFTLLQPDEYSPMRDFYQKVNTADQQQIALTNSAQKGN